MAMRRCLIVVAFLASASAAVAQEDRIAAGEKVFAKCRGCHIVGEGPSKFLKAWKVGPHLNALFGRKPGSLPDYEYSEGMVAFGRDKVWDQATLPPFLRDPRGVVKYSRMPFSGLKSDEEISAVLAYLATFDPEGMAPE